MNTQSDEMAHYFQWRANVALARYKAAKADDEPNPLQSLDFLKGRAIGLYIAAGYITEWEQEKPPDYDLFLTHEEGHL